MLNYADYVFYQKEFKGNISIDLFNSLITEASRIIDRNINRELTQEKLNLMSEIDRWKLAYVACSLCDVLGSKAYKNAFNDISSISIDSVSKVKKDPTLLEQIIDKKIKGCIQNLPDNLTRYL